MRTQRLPPDIIALSAVGLGQRSQDARLAGGAGAGAEVGRVQRDLVTEEVVGARQCWALGSRIRTHAATLHVSFVIGSMFRVSVTRPKYFMSCTQWLTLAYLICHVMR